MFTKVIATAAVLFAATAASAANPLDPMFKRYPDSTISVTTATGSVATVANNPLQPGFYQWDVAAMNSTAINIVERNPLNPSFKRA